MDPLVALAEGVTPLEAVGVDNLYLLFLFFLAGQLDFIGRDDWGYSFDTSQRSSNQAPRSISAKHT